MIRNDNAYENCTIRSKNPSIEGFFIKKIGEVHTLSDSLSTSCFHNSHLFSP